MGFASWALTTSSSPLNGVGSIAPGQALEVNVSGGLRFDNGPLLLQLSMPAQGLLRTDGTTYSVSAGSLTWTKVLEPSTTYYFYTDLRISDGTLHVAGGSSPAAAGGDPPVIPPTSPTPRSLSSHARTASIRGRRSPLRLRARPARAAAHRVAARVYVPDGRELTVTRERGIVRVSTVAEGEHVLGYCFEQAGIVWRKVVSVRKAAAWSWYLVNGYRMSPLDPVWLDGEWVAPYKVGTFDGGEGERVQITVEADEYDAQNYYLLGRGDGLLIHNFRIAPC